MATFIVVDPAELAGSGIITQVEVDRDDPMLASAKFAEDNFLNSGRADDIPFDPSSPVFVNDFTVRVDWLFIISVKA